MVRCGRFSGRTRGSREADERLLTEEAKGMKWLQAGRALHAAILVMMISVHLPWKGWQATCSSACCFVRRHLQATRDRWASGTHTIP